jgi:hypothetical protein
MNKRAIDVDESALREFIESRVCTDAMSVGVRAWLTNPAALFGGRLDAYVLRTLATFHADERGECGPVSHETLVADAEHYSRRTVISALKRLEDAGWITVTRGTRGSAPTYRIAVDRLLSQSQLDAEHRKILREHFLSQRSLREA